MESSTTNSQEISSPRLRCIIKLGGAAVTHKAQRESLQRDVLQRVCQSLANPGGGEDHGELPGGTVLVHGAGSFGHHPASEYGVARGPLSDPRVRRGFALTRRSVTKLNGHVVSELVEAGLPAVGLSPLGRYTTSNGKISTSGSSAVAECLRSGLVPVLHGDAVLDEQLGCTILSGDTVVRDLAERLRPQFVVFLTNVTGVFDRPPEEEGAVLLRRIAVRRDGSWRVAEVEGSTAAAGMGIRMTADAHDVTGGIALKVEEAARVARLGVPVLIAQAGTEDGAAACRWGPLVVAQPTRSRDAEPTGRIVADAAAAGAAVAGAEVPDTGYGDGAEEGSAGRGAAGCSRCSRGGARLVGGVAGAWRGTLVVLEDEERGVEDSLAEAAT